MRNATGKEKQDIAGKMQGEGVMTFTRLVRGCLVENVTLEEQREGGREVYGQTRRGRGSQAGAGVSAKALGQE